MKTIVTGGAGFIGSHLVDRLLADGCRGDRRRQLRPVLPPGRQGGQPGRGLAKPAVPAGRAGHPRRGRGRVAGGRIPPRRDRPSGRPRGRPPQHRGPGALRRRQRAGTVHWLEAASRLEPRPRFVYASSSSVYGDRPDAPFRETDPVDLPVSPYAATKKACELLAFTFHHLHGLPVTGLRFFTAYGPRNRPDLAIAKFTRLIDRGEPVPMFGDGTTRRDYTFVADIVDGIVRAIDRCTGHHLYNLGNSDPIELRQLIDAIGSALGKTPMIRRLPEQPGDVRQTYADISRAATELGYSPKTPIAEGLAQYVAWYRAVVS